MLSYQQWEACHEIWDGRAKNVSEVCGMCAACCARTEKLLFPGEHDYLQRKVKEIQGRHLDNVSWLFDQCGCCEYQVKPVICKVYPLKVYVDSSGYAVSFKTEDLCDAYSKRCVELTFDEEKVHAFLRAFLSDAQNRLSWFYHDNLAEFADDFRRKARSDHGVKFTLPETEQHLLEIAFMDMKSKNVYYGYEMCADRPDGVALPL